MSGAKTPKRRIRTVEKDPRGGWIARSPITGKELIEDGWRWWCRASARCAVWEEMHVSDEGRRAAIAATTPKSDACGVRA